MQLSIYKFPRRRIAELLYGEATAGPLRRIDAYLDGEKKMPVDVLYVLSQREPMLDVDATLRDMYARYEVASFRKNRKKKSRYVQERQGIYDPEGSGSSEGGEESPSRDE